MAGNQFAGDSTKRASREEKLEEPTRIELVIAVLQTAPLATWVRLRTNSNEEKAGDETRTRDIQLGKLAFYH